MHALCFIIRTEWPWHALLPLFPALIMQELLAERKLSLDDENVYSYAYMNITTKCGVSGLMQPHCACMAYIMPKSGHMARMIT